jgi:hypothetical protein
MVQAIVNQKVLITSRCILELLQIEVCGKYG